jgi:glycosyltransferase involved in cell wall biosynthesis
MRVSFLTPQYFPTIGGVPVLVRLIGRATQALGHDVTVITNEGNVGIEDTEIRVLRKPRLLELCRELRASDGVVTIQDCLSLAWPLIVLHRATIMVLQMDLARRDGVAGRLRELLRTWWLRRVKVVAASQNVAQTFSASYPQAAAVTIPNPYDATLFFPPAAGERRDLDLLFVGRLAIHKRCDVLIDALALLAGQSNERKLVIVGDGPERARLEKMARDRSVENLCNFLGDAPQVKVARLMRKSRVVVVPSGYEPFGIVVLEALACGCKVVTSDAGGLPEAGGGFSAIFRTNDPQDLTAKLRWTEDCAREKAVDRDAPLQDYLKEHQPRAIAEKWINELRSAGRGLKEQGITQ